MVDFEAFYTDREDKAAKQATDAFTKFNSVARQQLHEAIPILLSHFEASPPDFYNWVDIGDQRSVCWIVVSLGDHELAIALLPTGDLIKVSSGPIRASEAPEDMFNFPRPRDLRYIEPVDIDSISFDTDSDDLTRMYDGIVRRLTGSKDWEDRYRDLMGHSASESLYG